MIVPKMRKYDVIGVDDDDIRNGFEKKNKK